MFRSLRTRLVLLLLLLVAAATASGFVMFALFEQSTAARIGQAAALAARACDAISAAYRVYGGAPDLSDALVRRNLSSITFYALRDKPDIEGGLWQAGPGAFAYAFPTYEGSGPKTDVPEAELPRIVATNRLAQQDERPRLTRIDSEAQTLLIAACPLSAPIAHLSAWTLTRVHSLAGRTYWQLMSGLAILAVSVGLATIMALALIMTWSRHVAGIVDVLATPSGDELPALALTGERELDYIVQALNEARRRLIASHRETEGLARQVANNERLAALGRVTAGVAHAFRNPLAAMRLKAETALRGGPDRKDRALELVITQVDRLNGVVGRLLASSERDPIRPRRVELAPFLGSCAQAHRNAALARGVSLSVDCEAAAGWFDPEPVSLALSNLILNALQEQAPGEVALSAQTHEEGLVLAVSDRGGGPPEAIRDHLFDPFVSGRPDRAGLGLAIVREVASAHGGRAEFAREDGASVFRIILPCPQS